MPAFVAFARSLLCVDVQHKAGKVGSGVEVFELSPVDSAVFTGPPQQ